MVLKFTLNNVSAFLVGRLSELRRQACFMQNIATRNLLVAIEQFTGIDFRLHLPIYRYWMFRVEANRSIKLIENTDTNMFY
jgi:hypothetical protein